MMLFQKNPELNEITNSIREGSYFFWWSANLSFLLDILWSGCN